MAGNARIERDRIQVAVALQYLAATQVDDTAMPQIARFHELEVLSLEETAVTDTGAAAIDELPRLHALNLRGTKVSDERIEEIARRHPGLELVR